MDWPDDEIGKNRSGSADRQAASERHWSSGTSRSADWRRACDMGSASADHPVVHIIRISRFGMTIATRLELLTSSSEQNALPVVSLVRARSRYRRSIGIIPAKGAAPIWLSALTMRRGQAQPMLST